jgi:hypothetical protein
MDLDAETLATIVLAAYKAAESPLSALAAQAASYAPPGDVALRTDRRRQRLHTERTSCVRPGSKVLN